MEKDWKREYQNSELNIRTTIAQVHKYQNKIAVKNTQKREWLNEVLKV